MGPRAVLSIALTVAFAVIVAAVGASARTPSMRGTASGSPPAVASVDGATQTALLRAQPVAGEPVEVTGVDPFGDRVEATGTRQPDGTVALLDTTTQSYDPGSGSGAVETHDATGLVEGDEGRLPGPLVTAPSAEIDDPAAIAAHAYSSYVTEYFATVHGRDSWDGAGGTLSSSVHFGDPDFCNAFFGGGLMVYGDSCEIDGEVLLTSFVDIDTAGHEITHGVTSTSANLLYTGQSGAMNESFSDYFGNVIGNHYRGIDGAELFEQGCEGQPVSVFCQGSPEGGLASRYMLSGDTLADYLYLIDPPTRYKFLNVKIRQDHGGVHLNSSIWNNALWRTRTRLAQIDGVSANASPRAAAFDRVVYVALTRHLTPTSGFLDGRRAIEQAALELAVDPVISDVIRETFDLNLICAGCVPPPPSPAVPVVADALTQRSPVASQDGVAWVESDADEFAGTVRVRTADGVTSPFGTDATAASVAFAGDAVVATDVSGSAGRVVMADPATGETTTLDTPGELGVFTGVAGSAEGAAWVSQTNGMVNFVDPVGQVTSAALPDAATATDLFAVATGGGTVAVGNLGGVVTAWRVGQQPVVLDELEDRAILSIAASATHVLVISVAGDFLAQLKARAIFTPVGTATLYTIADGSAVQLSDAVAPFGAALTSEYAIWPQALGALGGGAAEQLVGRTAPDTDLFLFSLAKGVTYRLLAQRGQQGFPTLRGDRLVWIDTVNEGNDIFTGVIPSGL